MDFSLQKNKNSAQKMCPTTMQNLNVGICLIYPCEFSPDSLLHSEVLTAFYSY